MEYVWDPSVDCSDLRRRIAQPNRMRYFAVSGPHWMNEPTLGLLTTFGEAAVCARGPQAPRLQRFFRPRQDSSDGVTAVNEKRGARDKIGSLRGQINGGSR